MEADNFAGNQLFVTRWSADPGGCVQLFGRTDRCGLRRICLSLIHHRGEGYRGGLEWATGRLKKPGLKLKDPEGGLT